MNISMRLCAGDGHTVVTRSTSTYRTESSLGQQITSFSSNIAVSDDKLLRRCWKADRRLRHERITAICDDDENIVLNLYQMEMYDLLYSPKKTLSQNHSYNMLGKIFGSSSYPTDCTKLSQAKKINYVLDLYYSPQRIPQAL